MCWFYDIKLTFHKALIRSVMTYASPTCEFAADTHLLKLQRLQDKVLRTIGNFPRRTPVRNCIRLSIFPTFMIKLNSMVRVRERTIPTERPPTFMIIYQNYAGNNQKSYKIKEMLMSAI
jgi:hypothetical protein